LGRSARYPFSVLAMIGSGGGVAVGYELKAREAPPPICVEQKNLTGF
jgi:hypothetical protein